VCVCVVCVWVVCVWCVCGVCGVMCVCQRIGHVAVTDVDGNQRVFSLCVVNVRYGILKYEAGLGGLG